MRSTAGFARWVSHARQVTKADDRSAGGGRSHVRVPPGAGDRGDRHRSGTRWWCGLLTRLGEIGGCPEDLDTLDAYCATGSLRRAADLLHLRHSSVARRLEQLGKTLGIELTEPTGLIRARLALTAWRLLDD
ncbi:helix-turn-helix domain-containing protein [Saccharothrix deserti]|uniref:helix-turn-helix domain-containing protein n=1 Tax=Saccharothrix deserti TaxID=2593674 RepID=UPI001EE474E5|nr:helix-turn-helix domain-containing protein [Saccharothrix deserti]